MSIHHVPLSYSHTKTTHVAFTLQIPFFYAFLFFILSYTYGITTYSPIQSSSRTQFKIVLNPVVHGFMSLETEIPISYSKMLFLVRKRWYIKKLYIYWWQAWCWHFVENWKELVRGEVGAENDLNIHHLWNLQDFLPTASALDQMAFLVLFFCVFSIK